MSENPADITISKIIEAPVLSVEGKDYIVRDGAFHMVYEYRPRPTSPVRWVIVVGELYIEIAPIHIAEYLNLAEVDGPDRTILELWQQKEFLAQRIADQDDLIAQQEASMHRMRLMHEEEIGQLQKHIATLTAAGRATPPVGSPQLPKQSPSSSALSGMPAASVPSSSAQVASSSPSAAARGTPGATSHGQIPAPSNTPPLPTATSVPAPNTTPVVAAAHTVAAPNNAPAPGSPPNKVPAAAANYRAASVSSSSSSSSVSTNTTNASSSVSSVPSSTSSQTPGRSSSMTSMMTPHAPFTPLQATQLVQAAQYASQQSSPHSGQQGASQQPSQQLMTSRAPPQQASQSKRASSAGVSSPSPTNPRAAYRLSSHRQSPLATPVGQSPPSPRAASRSVPDGSPRGATRLRRPTGGMFGGLGHPPPPKMAGFTPKLPAPGKAAATTTTVDTSLSRIIQSGVHPKLTNGSTSVGDIKVVIAGEQEPNKFRICSAMWSGYTGATDPFTVQHKLRDYRVGFHSLIGMEGYEAMRPQYYRGASVILVGISLYDPECFSAIIDDWLPNIETECTKEGWSIPVILWATYKQEDIGKAPVVSDQMILDLMAAKPYIRECHVLPDGILGVDTDRAGMLLASCIEKKHLTFDFPAPMAFSLPSDFGHL